MNRRQRAQEPIAVAGPQDQVDRWAQISATIATGEDHTPDAPAEHPGIMHREGTMYFKIC